MATATVKIGVNRKIGAGGLSAVARRVESNANTLAYHYAQRIEGGAKRRAHVITGRMKRSIVRVRLGVGHHRVIVGAHYGIYEEYGTRHRPPHPFFRPAIREAKAAYDIEKRRVFR